MTDRDLESRLERLAQATLNLRPRPGFSERVTDQVAVSAAPSWAESIAHLGTRAFLLASVVAVMAMGWAIRSELAATEASAVAFAALDVDP